MTRRPTVRDIARHAEVAISTVSQVLNNRPGVSSELRQRVLDSAQELGYRQRVMLDTAIPTQLRTVALLTKHFGDEPVQINPFYSYVLAGAERECARRNIGLMYASIEVDENSRAISLPSAILDQRVDGLIIVGAFVEETISHISKQTGHNIVLVDAYTSGQSHYDSVLIDNQKGAYAAVTHLIQHGHKHIGLIGSHPDSYPSIQDRRRGYLWALRDHHIQDTYIEPGLLERSHGYEATQRLLQRHQEITAIFACNDNVAMGVMNAVQDMGRRIPDDFSVIGFDDIDLAQEVTPPLTTMHVDKVLLGAMALRMLQDRAEMPSRPALTTTLGAQLIERGSVGTI